MFAKIFDTKHGQVLVRKRNGDDDPYEVAFIMCIGDRFHEMTFAFDSKQDQERLFDEAAQGQIEDVAGSISDCKDGRFSIK